MNYKTVIGLEVHVELKTKSKMFCGCAASYFGEKPNTHTCPVCLGLPGALPVPNKQAIEWCIKIALALNCKINEFSKFDRKNYFYPDLAKGYQISQYDLPFGHEGSIEVKSEPEARSQKPEAKLIRIRRVHMEEDTGKLTHANVGGENVSLIDFNRSGVPLVEIVTEPDFENEFQVVQYLQKLQKIVRYLNVSNADMEKGEMRLEPNISLSEISNFQFPISNENLPEYKVEVKNINSFRFVDKAIKFEIDRQAKLLDEGKTPAQETRGWNETKNATVSQRSKEEAHDYRYFPEPDIPPITYGETEISKLKSQVGELPDEKIERFVKQYKIPYYPAEILTRNLGIATGYEDAVRIGSKANIGSATIANVVINNKIDFTGTTPSQVVDLARESARKDEISSSELSEIINSVLSENAKAVEEFKAGKENVLQFLLGQVIRKAGKKLDTNEVKNGILKIIKS